MKTSPIALLAALSAFAASAAPTLSFYPPNPTPADTIIVIATDTSDTCPYIARDRIFHFNSAIDVPYGQVGDCAFAPHREARAVLGRLPAGSYTVRLRVDFDGTLPPAVDTKTLTVALPPGSGGTTAVLPSDDYGGHYLTDVHGEGVFVQQFGAKTFVSFFTYGADGQPTWLVMPDTRWEYNATRSRYQFSSAVYTTQRSSPPPTPGTIAVTLVGSGVWYPQSMDVGSLEITVNGTPVNRTLTRFRF